MIVAASTRNGCSQEHACRGVNLFVRNIGGELDSVLFVYVFGSNRQERGGYQVLRPLLIRIDRQQVAGKLFLNEAVERFVFVERINDVVAVSPRVWVRHVHRATG